MSYNAEDNSKVIFKVLMGFSIAFILAALCAGDLGNLIPGFIRINTSPSQFTMDYFVLGGLGAAFLNTGMVGLACCFMMYITKAKLNGLSIAAYWLNVGFATFGMTFVTVWPFFLGGFVYSRIKKIPYGSCVNFAMFSTALAPFAGELMFRYPNLETSGLSAYGLILAIVLGIFTACCMPALCAATPAFHKGFDLYSAAPAAGFLAFLVYCIMYRSPGIEVPTNTNLGDGHKMFVNVFFLIVFIACFVVAYMLDKDCFKQYKAIWKSDGFKKDFTQVYGLPATMVNLGAYGLFILLYYNVVQGMTMVDGSLVFTGAKFTGATMGAIMCMYAFVAQGAHPRTVFPIMVGYAVASFLPFLLFVTGVAPAQNWTLTTQAILVGMCFASGLAPVSGVYGFIPGVIAGALHATLVMSVPLWHGGFCLYNGGFTCGIVAFLLANVLDGYLPKKAA